MSWTINVNLITYYLNERILQQIKQTNYLINNTILKNELNYYLTSVLNVISYNAVNITV